MSVLPLKFVLEYIYTLTILIYVHFITARMSFFNNKAGVTASTWGSMLKQAINTVESKIDKALDIGSESA